VLNPAGGERARNGSSNAASWLGSPSAIDNLALL
jgi:hypothetical protein